MLPWSCPPTPAKPRPSPNPASQPKTISPSEEKAALQREVARNRQIAVESGRRQAEQQAQAETKRTRQAATDAIGKYNEKVGKHQQGWIDQNGYGYRRESDAQLQDRWEKAWASSPEGKAAEKEFAASITDYDLAVQNELRMAADKSDAALEAKLKQIRDLDRSGSKTDKTLDDVASREARRIADETPELRSRAELSDRLDGMASGTGQAGKPRL